MKWYSRIARQRRGWFSAHESTTSLCYMRWTFGKCSDKIVVDSPGCSILLVERNDRQVGIHGFGSRERAAFPSGEVKNVSQRRTVIINRILCEEIFVSAVRDSQWVFVWIIVPRVCQDAKSKWNTPYMKFWMEFRHVGMISLAFPPVMSFFAVHGQSSWFEATFQFMNRTLSPDTFR
jgi:hypothetical protein